MEMKIGFLCLSLCFAAATSMSIKDSTDEQWEDYKKNFHKTYNSEEEPIRKANFEKNVEKINLNNERFKKGEVPHKMNINSFTDTESGMFNVTIDVPPTYDCRTQGYVSPVPNIANCEGGGWAFATIGMLEGYLFATDKVKNQLSAQDLIECSGDTYGNMGCSAGDVASALNYICENGIQSESSHPFNATVSICNKNLSRDGIPKGWEIKTTLYTPKSEEGLMQYHISSKGPIAAVISAKEQFLQHKDNIFTGGDCNANDNEDDDAGDYYVLIVGYGETDSKQYWIVKNWKGEEWGEKGYAKVARNKSTTCDTIFGKVIGIESIKK